MSLKILILEDSPTDAELIQRELKKGNIEFIALVTDTENGFISALNSFHPDIILSDHAMPGFNSIEALSICKKENYKCPFILVTGAVSEEFAVECIKAGADDYILKNKLIRLPSAVENALKKAVAEREKEHAIKNLEDQNIFMSLLLKSIPIAQYVCNEGTHDITYMSNNIFSFSGYYPDMFLADPHFWQKHLHPDDTEKAITSFRELTNTHECIIEYRWKVSDDTYRWIYDRARVVKNEHGKTFVAGAMIDITLRKEAEEKLLLKNKELNTFIYRSTHDLRGPLMTILGLTNVAQEEEELKELRNYITMIDECTHKLDDVLLSLITTISIKDTNIASKEVNFNEIISLLLEDCKIIDGFDKINILTEIDVRNNLYMDEFAINSILKNIIENAAKYTNQNNANPYISIYISDAENELRIEVKDNGMGISAGIKDKVFDMFFRGTQICKGSGLGLYIVKNAVEKLRGTIKLESTEGTGTTIEIKLPIQF